MELVEIYEEKEEEPKKSVDSVNDGWGSPPPLLVIDESHPKHSPKEVAPNESYIDAATKKLWSDMQANYLKSIWTHS